MLYLKSALPIAIIGFFFSLFYFLTVHFFEKKQELFIQKTMKTRNIVLKLVTYDFVFELFNVFYSKVLIPIAIWTQEKIVKGFIVKILFYYTYLWSRLLVRGLRKLIFDIIIPSIRKVFEKVSKFVRSLEELELKKQIYLAVIFVFIFLVVTVVFYFGGVIS
jgi:hypothetical protein